MEGAVKLLEQAARRAYGDANWRQILIGDFARDDATLAAWLANEDLVPDAVWDELLSDMELERQYRAPRRDPH